MWLSLATLACAKQRPVDPEVEFADALARTDRVWSARGELGFEAIDPLLYKADSIHHDHPEVRWRRARTSVSRGLVDGYGVEGRRWFAAARDESIRCLRDDPRVRAAIDERGWDAGLALVGPAREMCALWAAIAWIRWMDAFGADAAAVDRPVIVGLLDASPPEASELARYRALLEVLSPTGDPSSAREAIAGDYRTALDQRADDAWVRWEDLVRHDAARLLGPPGPRPRTPEDEAAAERTASVR